MIQIIQPEEVFMGPLGVLQTDWIFGTTRQFLLRTESVRMTERCQNNKVFTDGVNWDLGATEPSTHAPRLTVT